MAMRNQDPCADLIDHSHVLDFEVKLGVKIALTVLYGLIFLAGILGNSITIRATMVLQNKGYLQKGVADHMISLACSDLLVILLGMPVELYSLIWFPFSTSHGNITCKIYCFLFEACSYATVFHVATLSFERYIAICHPFKFKSISGSCTVKIMITFAWVTAVCVALPFIFSMGTEYPLEPVEGQRMVRECNRSSSRHLYAGGIPSNTTICTSLSSKWVVFQSSIFSAFIVYILVLASVGFMCRKMMKALLLAKNGAMTVKGKTGSTAGYMTKNTSSEARSARKQTIVFLGLIVATLAICWMPNQILRIMAASKPKQDWSVSYFRVYITLLPIADTFFYLSSVVNPLLYNISSKQFRKVFLQVLRCHLTIQHVNKEKLLKASSSAKSTSYKRPFIFMSSRQNYSTKRTNKSFLSTFQSGPKPQCHPEKFSLESLEPNTEIKPPEESSETRQAIVNGLSESEI
ncbi:G-protein coupled receptor 39 [Microcaecilia unicolor]|uniref:G-protein coupled receptor 39 n=1 Tax=Microcaecilia unicolor TaxID=1415580 RepID=A0A6P7YEH1_9AMPH|nr:G-protein coupled receptor 39 [Microcaecilia unicolor]